MLHDVFFFSCCFPALFLLFWSPQTPVGSTAARMEVSALQYLFLLTDGSGRQPLFNSETLACDLPWNVDCGTRPICDENDQNCYAQTTTVEPTTEHSTVTDDATNTEPSTTLTSTPAPKCEDYSCPAGGGLFPLTDCGRCFCFCTQQDSLPNGICCEDDEVFDERANSCVPIDECAAPPFECSDLICPSAGAVLAKGDCLDSYCICPTQNVGSAPEDFDCPSGYVFKPDTETTGRCVTPEVCAATPEPTTPTVPTTTTESTTPVSTHTPSACDIFTCPPGGGLLSLGNCQDCFCFCGETDPVPEELCCRDIEVFDETLGRCVPDIDCVRPVYCSDLICPSSGATLSRGDCLQDYCICPKENVGFAPDDFSCPDGQVYVATSDTTGRCRRVEDTECAADTTTTSEATTVITTTMSTTTMSTTTTTDSTTTTTQGSSDDPCSTILCPAEGGNIAFGPCENSFCACGVGSEHGGETFCAPTLVFNGDKGFCDYPSNVPGCSRRNNLFF